MEKLFIQDGYKRREMTETEMTEYQQLCAEIETQTNAERDKELARQSALAKLTSLGLTADEIIALVG